MGTISDLFVRLHGAAGEGANFMAAEDGQGAKARIMTALVGRADLDAACVSLITGSAVERVVYAFGADLSAPPVARDMLPEDALTMSVVEVGGGVLVVEDNGYQGSLAEVMRPASAGGRMASMFWNSVAESSMSFAERGRVVDSGEYFHDRNPFTDPDIAGMVDEIAAFAHENSSIMVGLLAVERFTDVRIDAPAASPPALVHRILPRLEDHSSDAEGVGAVLAAAGEAAGALVNAVRAATPQRQRYLAAVIALQVLARAGLDGHPDLADTIATILRPGGAIMTDRAELFIRRTLDPAGRPPAGHMSAVRVLHRSANPDPHVAALEAVKYATYTVPRAVRDELYARSTQVITS